MRVALLAVVGLSSACAPDVELADATQAQALARGTDSTRENVAILAGLFSCSAVLIGPRVVLSARHCVADPSTGAVDDAAFTVRFGPLRDAEPELEIAVREVRVPLEEPFGNEGGGEFLMEMNGRDLAVAILEEDAPFTPADIVRAPPESIIGTTVTLVGYGLSDDAAELDGVRRETEAVVTDASGVLLAFEASPLCAGDSGGPAFTEDGALLGVHSFGAGTQAQCGQNTGVVNGVWGELTFLDLALNSSDACPSGDLVACAPVDDEVEGGCGSDGQAAFLPFLWPLVRLRRRLSLRAPRATRTSRATGASRASHASRASRGIASALVALVALFGLGACAGAGEGEGEGEGEVELVSYGLRDCPVDTRESVLGNPNVVNALVFARVDAPAGVPLTQVRVHTVWSPNLECRCDAAHRISVYRSTALSPEPNPERVFSADVPGATCNVVGEITVDLDAPLVLADGEVAYVAVEMTGNASSMTCVAACSGDAVEPGWGSTTEPAPYQYVDLIEGGAKIAPRFELLGAP